MTDWEAFLGGPNATKKPLLEPFGTWALDYGTR